VSFRWSQSGGASCESRQRWKSPSAWRVLFCFTRRASLGNPQVYCNAPIPLFHTTRAAKDPAVLLALEAGNELAPLVRERPDLSPPPAMPAAGLQASEANAESLKPAEAPKTGKSKGSHRRRSHGKSDAEVNLMNQMWSDPALPGIPGSGSNSPPRQSSPNTLKNQHQAAGATEGPNRDLDDFLNREFVRDVETAQRFINQNDDELFVAARAAANGGAGSLAVLLRTLETQVRVTVGVLCKRGESDEPNAACPMASAISGHGQ